jgi:hypothetical protein
MTKYLGGALLITMTLVLLNELPTFDLISWGIYTLCVVTYYVGFIYIPKQEERMLATKISKKNDIILLG